MGASLQWRGENEREPARYGRIVAFGNLRDKATGYMSYSDRVGPGIVVVGGSPALCDFLTQEGFTALAPELGHDEAKNERVLDAAIDHLVDNWHPRVGVVGIGAAGALVRRVTDRKTIDGLAILDTEDDLNDDLIDDFRYDLS